MSSKIFSHFIRTMSVSLILFISFTTVTQALAYQQSNSPQQQVVPEFPTGAVVAFPDPIIARADGKLPVDKIFIRQDPPANSTVWIVEPQEVIILEPAAGSPSSNPATSISPSNKGIGFVVPQLDKGTYEAWYEAPSQNQPGQSMKLMVIPQLLAEEGIKRGSPSGSTEVRVKISSSTIFVKNNSTPMMVSVPVRLQTNDTSVADVAAGQSATVMTDAAGYAIWKVQIKRAGKAEFTATANNFEPATVYVVGMPAATRTLAEAELQEAEAQATAREAEAIEAAARVTTLVAKAQEETQTAKSRITEAQVTLEQLPATAKSRAEAEVRVKAREEDRQELAEKAEERVAAARTAASDAQQRAVEARAVVREKAARMAAQVSIIKESDLKPGDVLLVQGSTPIVSRKIMRFESDQLGGTTPYSHASLYLGEIGGVKMVAEMWSSGYWITPLSVSIKGTIIVDVFRWSGIDDNKRAEIARKGANIFGDAFRYIRSNDPSFFTSGSPVPYAYEEIVLLGMSVSPLIPDVVITGTARNLVDPRAGGRRKMICSELVAWIYRDMGLDPQVTFWRRLNSAGVFTNDDRRKDYTTPNMLARSPNFHLVGRLKEP
jgi:hypothetical protein